MIGNKIDDYAVYILIVIYIVHVIVMKFNHVYEVAIKKAVSNMFEVAELKRLSTENKDHFHLNLDSRTPCIELLNKIIFKQEGEILIFENNNNKVSKLLQNKGAFMARQNNQLRYRMKPIHSIKI